MRTNPNPLIINYYCPELEATSDLVRGRVGGSQATDELYA